jgi:hypothetical protein
MDMLRKKNYLGIAALVFMILGAILPYFKVLGQGISLLKYWEGYVIFLMAFYSALVVFKDFCEKNIAFIYNAVVTGALGQIKNLKGAKGLLIPAAIVALLMVYLHISVENDVVKYGLGFYVEALGVICLVAHAFLYVGDDETTQPAVNADMNQQPTQPQQPMMNQQPAQPQQPMMNQQPQQPMMNQQPTQPQQPMMNQQQGQPVYNNNQFPGNNGF